MVWTTAASQRPRDYSDDLGADTSYGSAGRLGIDAGRYGLFHAAETAKGRSRGRQEIRTRIEGFEIVFRADAKTNGAAEPQIVSDLK
jgi:hypothetical protein